MKSIRHILDFFGFIFGRTNPMTGPMKATWNVTYLCNSRCSHCNRWKRKPAKELTTQEGKNLIRQLADCDVLQLSFSGGEPLIRKDIFELIGYAKSLDMSTSINTNALCINQETAKRIVSSGIDLVYISLDSSIPDLHERIRGVKGSFNKAMYAIDLLRKESKKNKPMVYINTTITRENIGDILNIAKLCSDKKVNGFTLQPIHESCEMGFLVDSKERIDKKCALDLEREIDTLYSKYKNLLPHGREYYRSFREFLESPEKLYRYRCIAGFEMVMISPYGDVFTCPMEFQKMGNIREKSFRDIWFSKEAGEFRDDIKKNRHPICCFDCVMPFNIMAYQVHPFRIHRLLDKELLFHILRKFRS